MDRMMTLARSIALLGLGAVFGGCAAKQAPPVQHYALGMSRAEYRDYTGAKASPCDSEPRWFQDELTAVNGLLARFIKETEQALDPDGLEHAKQLALLEEGLRTLPPVLKVHESNLQALKACDFRRAGAFPDLAQRGATLLSEARERMALGPEIQAAAALREAQKQWREQGAEREAKAKETWCPKPSKVGQPDLYFARESPEGKRTEWFFCDGHVVEKAGEAEATLLSPEGLSKAERRRVQAKKYLGAALAYPPEEVDRQPTAESLQKKPAASDNGSAAEGAP
ncbi:hypothetical protein D7X55_23540 [Corallococcus sp. AB049A]|uniref:Lipoprotein n=2 Tax=Myxococcaceae TaxID=31 RepID=A0A3A8QAB1_9BACT|nr:hypothetical protein D7Y23_18220 [Corallococcus sp. AB050B]RKH65546.1 hypothetical protein D7X96_23620 [Corallococcus interemptor]RKI61091.1 hypothetical protein D7X55_23540 [Corallococcus sp. AB049A]